MRRNSVVFSRELGSRPAFSGLCEGLGGGDRCPGHPREVWRGRAAGVREGQPERPRVSPRSTRARFGIAVAAAWLLVGPACRSEAGRSDHAPHDAPHAPPDPHARGAHAPAASGSPHDRGAPTLDQRLREVERVHGGAGPWAVAGYRMGEHALAKLGLERQSFDLEVVHRSPRSVQYSCIADGAAAATGASLGKLNLSLEEADEAHVATVYRRKSTGAAVTLRPAAAFAARFADVPRAELAARGREVMELPADQVFEEVR